MNIRPLKHVAVAASLLGLTPLLDAQSDMSQQQRQQQQQQQQRSQQQQSNTSMQQGQSSQRSAQMDPRGRTLKDLKGTDIVSSTGEKLGDVDDFILYSQTGKIAFAVVGSGGVLGVGETLRAVPYNALQPDPSDPTRMTLQNVDKTKFEQAPTFNRDQISTLSQQSSQLASYYGVQLQQAMQGASQKVQQTAQKITGQQQSSSQQQFVLGSKVIGRDVLSGQQEIGTVDDILVQSKSGSSAAVLDVNDEFAGTDQHVVVPFAKLTQSGEDAFTTTLTRQDISSAKQISDDSWATGAEGAMSSVFLYAKNAWGRATDATANAANRVSQEAREASNNVRNSTTKTSQAPVDAIKRAVQQSAGSASKNIQVTTSGDKVVLSGVVPSEDIKDTIEDRAEQAAQGWDIENQIRVASDIQ